MTSATSPSCGSACRHALHRDRADGAEGGVPRLDAVGHADVEVAWAPSSARRAARSSLPAQATRSPTVTSSMPAPTSTTPAQRVAERRVGVELVDDLAVGGAQALLATLCMTFSTWSGRARALPSSDMPASQTFIISVPVEISENSVRTSTPPGLHGRHRHVEQRQLAGLVVLHDLLHGSSCGARSPAVAARYQYSRVSTARDAWSGPAARRRPRRPCVRTSAVARRPGVDQHALVDQPRHRGQVAAHPGPQRRAEQALGPVDDLLGQEPGSAACLRTALPCRPAILALPGIANAAATTSTSTNGTRTSVEAAMLDRSV